MTYIEIVNLKAVYRAFRNIDLKNNVKVRADVRKVMYKPMRKMQTKAKSNLRARQMGGNRTTGNLYRGLRLGSRYKSSKGEMSVAFGGKGNIDSNKPIKRGVVGKYKTKKYKSARVRGAINHFHLINSGTKARRQNTTGRFTGAVGKSRTNYRNKNTAFSIGFADNAIRAIIPSIPGQLTQDLARIYINYFENYKP